MSGFGGRGGFASFRATANERNNLKSSNTANDGGEHNSNQKSFGSGFGGNSDRQWNPLASGGRGNSTGFSSFKEGDNKDRNNSSQSFGRGGGSSFVGRKEEGAYGRGNNFGGPPSSEGGGFRREQESSEGAFRGRQGSTTQGLGGTFSRFNDSAGGADMGGMERRAPVTYTPTETDVNLMYETTRIQAGDLFEKFFEAEVKITRQGGIVRNPPVFNSFADMRLTEQLAKNVQRSGYSRLTPIQKYGMPWIMEGCDILGCAQTGSGKTAAFLLPMMTALISSNDCASNTGYPALPRCIIVAPTRELAVQIHNEARKFGNGTICTSAVVYGGTSVRFQSDALMRGASIVVGTIGRLCQFISEGTISLKKVRFVVVDEADRMLDMGFKDQVVEILTNTQAESGRRQTLMFSATFPPEVQTLAQRFLRPDYAMVAVDSIGAANKCVVQEFIEVPGNAKKDRLLELLTVDAKKYDQKQGGTAAKKTLVFVNTKRFADILAGILLQSGLSATTIHGDREQREREIALSDFRMGRASILIATAVAERGLDINNVDHVINYDLPDSRDDYIHRIGRTGRVGNPGVATSFVDPEKDSAIVSDLLNVAVEAQQVVPDFMLRMAGVSSNTGGFGGRTAANFTQANGGGEEDDWD